MEWINRRLVFRIFLPFPSIQAAFQGNITDGCVIYCTHKPCIICTKMLINAGVKKIYCAEYYPDKLADEMLKEAGIEVEVLNG